MKKIHLRGKYSDKFMLVDDSDFEYLSKYKWYYEKPSKKSENEYAKSYIDKKFVKAHRIILGISGKNNFVDHIDGNGLNNQKNNIRVCSSSDNQKNKKRIYGTSRFRGVNKHPGGWVAKITINKKQKHLGLFQDEVEAAKAFNKAAIESGNQFFVLNKF